MNNEIAFTPSDFVAVLNQTLEYAYPSVVIVGELANFRVSKGRWVYFDLKDETASVKFFGTVYSLPGPLEEGMVVRVIGQPRLSAQYGFSITFQSITPVGAGALKRAADLLKLKLTAEGLFDESRKRPIPYPPQRIGLITSAQSAAYQDFIKILNARWQGVQILLADVQVQGDAAPAQIVEAIEVMNQQDIEVLVLTRGGGSADDLAAFSTEQVTRAVAGSRIPTLVAIGHEVDVSLAELAADRRASTPSNAAELLTPDRMAVQVDLMRQAEQLDTRLQRTLAACSDYITTNHMDMTRSVGLVIERARTEIASAKTLLEVLSPSVALRRGYAVVRSGAKLVRSTRDVSSGELVSIALADGTIQAEVQ